MPTQSSTASFTTPSASTCPATASAEPARNHPTRVDRTKRSVSLITSQRGSTPWATSCRNTGRHQIGMPGRLHRNQHGSSCNAVVAVALKGAHGERRDVATFAAESFSSEETDAQAALVDRVVETVAALENGNAYAYGIARGSFDEYASLPVASTQFLRR